MADGVGSGVRVDAGTEEVSTAYKYVHTNHHFVTYTKSLHQVYMSLA